jgi:hypothetical protein
VAAELLLVEVGLPLEKTLGTTVAVSVGASSAYMGSCLSLAGEAQVVYLGAFSSNLLGLTSTSKLVDECLLLGLGSSANSEEEANDGGFIIISVAAASLPSLLDLESTLRLFNLRLWNKLMVISGLENVFFHISASFEAEASKIHKCFRVFSGFFQALELVCSVSLRGQRPPLGCR